MSAVKNTPELAKIAREINRLHREITEAAQTSLQRSMEIGEMLKGAKESVGHGKWEEWLATNCPDISDRTARLYMRLAKAENATLLEAAAAENGNAVADLSVRGAAKLLAKPRDPNALPKPRAKKVVAPADLKDLLENVGADELDLALLAAEWENERR